MIMNSDKLKNMIAKKANGNSTMAAQFYQMFFFERLLDRVSKSKYKDNIILKGGLLLSSIIGEDMRTTKDMDITLKSLPLNKEDILSIMNEIINVKMNDNVSFEIIDIKDIRNEDIYGGFRINLLGVFEKLKVNMFVEFTTGDIITPKEIDFYYNCIFEQKKIPIMAYTVETIIAEKFHTIISRNISNTRLKDFYDIAVLLSEDKKYNDNTLITAIHNTFKKRNTDLNIEEIFKTIELINNDNNLQILWHKYQLKYIWSKEIEYDHIITKLNEIANLLKDKN